MSNALIRYEDVPVDSIVVNDRLRKISDDAVRSLMESMKVIGLIHPITVTCPQVQPVLMAGLHRLEAAKRLGWENIPCMVAPPAEQDKAALAEIDENLIRNELSPAERAMHIQARKEIYERLFPETKHGGAPGKAGGGKKAKEPNSGSFVSDTTAKTGRSKSSVKADSTRATHIPQIAAVVGTSLDKGEELDALAKLAPEKQAALIADAQEGKTVSARTVAKADRREEKLQMLSAALPAGRYAVVYADPPWRFEPYSRETGMDRAADNHYPTMTLDAIKALPVQDIAGDDCVLWLWATAPMLPEALEVMAAWGFTYKSHQIWLKDRIGTGYWFRNQHELLLVGTRGNIPAPLPGTQFTSVEPGVVGRHSEKPGLFASEIEELFPNVPKIELFARARRPGWIVWGNEAEDAA